MLDDITAFVTGASQGIGREIAIALADHGANVALAARSVDALHETADEIGDDDRTLVVETDVSEESAVESAIAETVETFGGLDCLVNNAGIAGPTDPVDTVDLDDWEQLMAVNVRGVYLCTKHAAPHLRESDRGSVVTISSVGGKKPYPLRTPYATSKMAVIGFNRAISHELGEDGVTANVICPGAVEGERIERVFRERAEAVDATPEELRQESVSDLPIQEIVPPEEIAEATAYLAGPHARHITGQDINISSGSAWF